MKNNTLSREYSALKQQASEGLQTAPAQSNRLVDNLITRIMEGDMPRAIRLAEGIREVLHAATQACRDLLEGSCERTEELVVLRRRVAQLETQCRQTSETVQ